MFKLLAPLLVCALAIVAQTNEVGITSIKNTPVQTVYGYSGSNLVYACAAKSVVTTGPRAQNRVSVSAATNANPVVFTSTGHGFAISGRPRVTISGGTGSWTATNGTFAATVVDANTFSIPVDSTAFGALAGTVIFSTTAPRLTVGEWQVQLYVYDGSSNLIWNGWLGGSTAMVNKCSDAALTTTVAQ